MTLFLRLAASAIISALLLIGGILTGQKLSPPSSQVSFGATGFTPVGGSTYTLQGAGVTATQNTIPLTSFTTPDGRAITMSMFGSIGYGVLEPNTNSKIEDVTFTGVTQNSNGSATLTGVTRGNDFVSPYAASTTLAKAHAGGSYFILSNTAGFYGQQFLFANNAATSTAFLVFSSTTPPKYDFNPTFASYPTTTLASTGYVASTQQAGASPASNSIAGISILATAAQAALGTATQVFNAITYSLVPPNSLFNATQSATTIIPVTNTSGKLSQLFLDLTQQFTFSGGLLSTGSSTFTATTSIAASNVLSDAFRLNGIPYAWPSSQGAASSFLQNNGSGVVSWTTSGLTSAVSTSTTFTQPSSNNSTATGNVICVSPKLVVGGGYSGLQAVTNNTNNLGIETVTANYPSSSNTWTVSLTCNGNNAATCNAAQTITIYAMCVNP